LSGLSRSHFPMIQAPIEQPASNRIVRTA